LSQSIAKIAIDIICRTNDGDDLAPEHLKLVENAVNGFLNENGKVEFYRLHKMVKAGYKKPWFHGIENFTIDHVGYVYWKGKRVEHYNFPWAYSEDGYTQALELARRCKILEGRGIEPSSRTAIWKWPQSIRVKRR